ncbi:TetR/AcrR family transcriptional regulator [Sediminispirochaeta bajacaliforniensis]|uniref:TetR/AcrR family transcriptional regulator n=1 Tax=Sediminispirochaeta bajacaliforniensis TaxID=148 RepID=UPI0003747011|nr:TetR/AcrR family transcriptional regulator [Sediminispirochaeta bajacaliforniensis]
MPKIVNKDEVRTALATKALALFRRYGYRSLSLRTLVAELGISKSGFYHYFAGKEELFHFCGELLTDMLERELALVSSSAVTETDTQALIEMLISYGKKLLPDYLDELGLLVDFAREDGAGRSANSVIDRYRGLFRKIFGEAGYNAAMQLFFGFLSLTAVEGGAADWDQLRNGLHLFIRSC